jgi:tetratricopeptide (TPR) repeat protein
MATRGEAWLRLCKLDIALQDVNEVLEANPHHVHSLAVKADSLFQQCHFEHALANYERGLRLSAEPLAGRFLIGKARASESIM